LWIVDWRVRLTLECSKGGHLEMVACRRLTSAIAIQKFSEVMRRRLRILSFEEHNRYSKVFRGYFCRVGT
jgi:hypothetical protein